MCGKRKLTIVEAQNIVVKDETNKLNGSKKRPQVHYYYCRSCLSYHTTTIPKPCYKK